MLKRRNITVRTPEERAQARADREERERQEYGRLLADLDDYDFSLEGLGGRPKIWLPPEIAQRVLADVRAGHSLRAIARKYQHTPWPFSYEWLRRSVNDGSLEEMASLVNA